MGRKANETGETSARLAAEAIRTGAVSSERLVASCLERIADAEACVRAWVYLDPDSALEQARAADSARMEGAPLGPLHGVPVAVKDIFDTKDMPTENGTVLQAGRRPRDDASVVAQLRAAGAVIMGKTVTTELAIGAPGATRNPLDPARTPGGSSSGSAAAVAAHMVPLALGSQTNGSVIRPASFCGLYGYKPTHGLISRHNTLMLSRSLDHVGAFARTLADLALLAEAIMAYDSRDPDMRPGARPHLVAATEGPPPAPPRLAFVRSPVWELASEESRLAFGKLFEDLAAHGEAVELPEAFDHAIPWHRTILEAELARNFAPLYARGRDRLSARPRAMIEAGRAQPAGAHGEALGHVAGLKNSLGDLFRDFDAILTPAAAGAAPIGLESTGSRAFNALWTLCGVPAVTVPILRGASGMPIGAQLVAARGDDAGLFRHARWLADVVGM